MTGRLVLPRLNAESVSTGQKDIIRCYPPHAKKRPGPAPESTSALEPIPFPAGATAPAFYVMMNPAARQGFLHRTFRGPAERRRRIAVR